CGAGYPSIPGRGAPPPDEAAARQCDRRGSCRVGAAPARHLKVSSTQAGWARDGS
ncbi:hypothetical protein MNEG_13401, partial [Monoraphidium neglectum]